MSYHDFHIFIEQFKVTVYTSRGICLYYFFLVCKLSALHVYPLQLMSCVPTKVQPKWALTVFSAHLNGNDYIQITTRDFILLYFMLRLRACLPLALFFRRQNASVETKLIGSIFECYWVIGWGYVRGLTCLYCGNKYNNMLY